jgi:cytoskeletal protein RodZ
MEPAGTRLKKIRKELGISLEEVQKRTKIHLNILKAIEGESLTNLSPVYLKGFLKIYCKFLGVDPGDYIDDYKESSYKVSEKAASKIIQAKQDKPLPKATSIKLPSFRLSKKVIKIFIFIIIVIILWIILFNLGKTIYSKRKSYPKRRIQSAILAKQKGNKNVLKTEKVKPVVLMPKPEIPQTIPQKEAVSGIRLGIRAHENCWISLKADGKLVFQRVLEKGRFQSWQAKNKMELSLANAQAVELEVNGQVFSNLGRKKQALKNILITKEGLKIGK